MQDEDRLTELLKTHRLVVTKHAMEKANAAKIKDEQELVQHLRKSSAEFEFFPREAGIKFARYGFSQVSTFYYYCPFIMLLFTLTINEAKKQVVVVTVTDKHQSDDVHLHGYLIDPHGKVAGYKKHSYKKK